MIPSTKAASKVLDWVFIVLLPNYNLGNGMANLYNNYNFIDSCFNEYPKALGFPAGKDSLNKICNFAKLLNQQFPCCKGENTSR